MDSNSDIFARDAPTVVVVHSPRAVTAEPKRAGKVLPRGNDPQDPRNYLLSGGARALDKEREKQKAQAAREKVKELKTASSALASELLRTRQESEREITSLRDNMIELTNRFKNEQERIATLKQRLAEETTTRSELEGKHQERVRELHRRLQAEHLLRVNAEMELVKIRDKSSSAASQIKGVEEELAGALAEVSALQDAKLDMEMSLNKERRMCAEAQGQLESLKVMLDKEKAAKEALQRKNAELEGTVRGLTERNSSLFEDLRACEGALHSAKDAKALADGAAAHHKEEARLLHEQLESKKRAQAAAADDNRRLQQRLVELEAGTAVYIAKEAHYDDLKEEFDDAVQRLQRTQSDLERAKHDVQSLMDKLDRTQAKASSLELNLKQRNDDCTHLKEELETASADHRAALAAVRKEAAEGEESLAESQAAVKLLMATVKERDAALAKLEAQAAEMQGSLEGARRGRDEMGRAMQQKDELANQLRQDLRVLRDELTACQRRNKQMLAEADAAELELSRRDLKLKELSDTVHVLTTEVGDEQTNAASEKRRMEGVIRSLESRLSQTQTEMAGIKQDLTAAQQNKINSHAELVAAQEECTHLRSQLNEEQTQNSKLRNEQATVSSSHMKEVESKGQVVADVMARLQAEEAAKVTAEHEARALKRRIEDLETSLAEAQEAQTRTAEAYDNSQAALETMKRKLQVYKKENKNLMSSYDDWLKQMVKSRPGGAVGGQ
ncbi:hypothetical protein N2152v2_010099 [Parachlorella kessleri]